MSDLTVIFPHLRFFMVHQLRAEVEPLSSLFARLVGNFKELEPRHEKDFEAELKAHGFSPPSCTADRGLLLSFITFGYCRRCSSSVLQNTNNLYIKQDES
ncbi:hypothetical protein ACFX2I_030160 [Malus domestica]